MKQETITKDIVEAGLMGFTISLPSMPKRTHIDYMQPPEPTGELELMDDKGETFTLPVNAEFVKRHLTGAIKPRKIKLEIYVS